MSSEIRPVASAQHDSSALLPTGERSNRFSESKASFQSIDLGSFRSIDQNSLAVPFSGPLDISLPASPTATPPPERSWRALIGSSMGAVQALAGAASGAAGNAILATGSAIGQAAATVGKEVLAQGASLRLLKPPTGAVGAAAGHLIHQSVTVGVPTFLREMMAETLVLSMRHMPPDHALGLQVGMGVIGVGAQFIRRARENRDPEAAARGFHAMSEPQWNALPEADKVKLRQQQQDHSRMVTNLQIMASTTQVAVGMLAARADQPDTERAVKLFAADFKALLYSGVRDSLQASFRMVNTAAPTTGGVSGAHMTASAKFYALANVIGNYGHSYLPALTPHAATADAVLRGNSTELSHGQAWMAKAGVSAVKAAINTAVEAADWFSVTQQEASQSGTIQQWDPKLKFLKPEDRDYGRVLDQTPARITAIGAGNAIFSAVGFAMKDAPEWAQNASMNIIEAAYEGLKYKTIGGTWQANAAVREATNSQQAGTLAANPDTEMGGAGSRTRQDAGRRDEIP
ncbi:hypothetical protein J2W49_001926 [Hydrogenophaga palleronii]|uniref:Uncharacterized protein n=1 Tax=Hydrogenophaga palleronii TaxID=65655 RepID=A0ABU1WLT3_9BURK|nr:hypothetical protein [Hydrogenophaga palleronii]